MVASTACTEAGQPRGSAGRRQAPWWRPRPDGDTVFLYARRTAYDGLPMAFAAPVEIRGNMAIFTIPTEYFLQWEVWEVGATVVPMDTVPTRLPPERFDVLVPIQIVDEF